MKNCEKHCAMKLSPFDNVETGIVLCLTHDVLTLSQTTNFRLFQTERVC